jgi:hypothetical protein
MEGTRVEVEEAVYGEVHLPLGDVGDLGSSGSEKERERLDRHELSRRRPSLEEASSISTWPW